MVKSGLTGFLGLVLLAGCSSTTSHRSDSSNGSAEAGASPAGGAAGSDGTTATGGQGAQLPGDPTTATGFCTAFYAFVDGLYAKCWGLSLSDTATLFPGTELCSRFIKSIDQHRTGFDGSKGAACLNELQAALSCDGAEMDAAPSCNMALTSLVAPGGACTASYDVGGALVHECAGDAVCRESSSDACEGVCVERSPIGATCGYGTADGRCATGATCDSATQKCVATPPPAALGESCGGTVAGKCQSGLWCDRGSGGAAATGVCSAKKASGACKLTEECKSSLVCAGAPGASTCVSPKPSGAACTPGNRECGVLGHCNSEQKCSNVGEALGKACGIIENEAVPCADGAYCEGGLFGPGVCQTPKRAGEACTGTSLGECGDHGGHCDAATHTCISCS